MKKITTTLLSLFALLALTSVTQARLAGKNVVLVHGFRATDLRDHPGTSQLKSLASQYWSAYWASRAEAIIYWGSDGRISGTIKDQVKAQFKALESAGTCANGCVFVTHSTGDLVTRYALKKLGQWGISTQRFKVLAVLDFAGAGGGTEIADAAVAVSEGEGWVNSAMKNVVNLFMGFTPERGKMGVLYDLQPANARNIATGSNSYPRLRFAGTGWQYAGLTKPFISGADDSVVPLHSACGASSAGAFDSCSRNIQPNGVITNVSNAPSSLWYNHYAVLMGEKTNHSDAINTTTGNEYATVSNHFTRNGITVDFTTTTGTKWWSWGRLVRWVKNGASKSMSANVYDTLNN